MENFLRTAPKTEIKRVFKAALELETARGNVPERRPVFLPSFGGADHYVPVAELLEQEQLVLRSR